jgi:hypothetical protein
MEILLIFTKHFLKNPPFQYWIKNIQMYKIKQIVHIYTKVSAILNFHSLRTNYFKNKI